MRTVLLVNGPVPPEGKEFCPVCVMIMRNRADVYFKDQMQAGLNVRTEEPLVLDMAEAQLGTPEFAEVVGISIMAQLGLVRVCWGHMMSLQLSVLPPAMAGQMPGVPSLGGR